MINVSRCVTVRDDSGIRGQHGRLLARIDPADIEVWCKTNGYRVTKRRGRCYFVDKLKS